MSARSVPSPRPAPTVLWQARVPVELAADLEQDMKVLGLEGQSETIREALRLLHRRAREVAMAREHDEFYGGQPAPLSEFTAALYAEGR